MEPTIGKPFMFLPTAREVCDASKDTYSDANRVKGTWHAKQGESDLTIKYNELMT